MNRRGSTACGKPSPSAFVRGFLSMIRFSTRKPPEAPEAPRPPPRRSGPPRLFRLLPDETHAPQTLDRVQSVANGGDLGLEAPRFRRHATRVPGRHRTDSVPHQQGSPPLFGCLGLDRPGHFPHPRPPRADGPLLRPLFQEELWPRRNLSMNRFSRDNFGMFSGD